MGTNQVEKFFEKAAVDVSIQEELGSLMEDGGAVACCTFSALAARHGFEFSPEELHDAIEELRRSEDGQELTDEDLELVAGGTPPLAYRIPYRLPGPQGGGRPMVQVRYGVPGRPGSCSGSVTLRYAVPPGD